MANRTPSFVLVGLVMITFLVAFFYMSCSSKTTELQQTLDKFEERIRSLTLKNNDKDREIETIKTKKSEVEAEKFNIQKQMNKKDSEFHDLNTKLNEKIAEIRSLRSDKQVLDEQLKEFQNRSETLASKNSIIEKLQQEYNEQKKSDDEQLTRLKQEIENYKNQLNNSQNNHEESFKIPDQRFRPLLGSNETARKTSPLFQEPLDKLSNIKNKINIGDNSKFNQNIPAPPLSNNTSRRSLDLGIAGDRDNQERDNSQIYPRAKSAHDTENDDKQRLGIKYVPKVANRYSGILLNEINIANNQSDILPSPLLANHRNYRFDNRKRSQKNLKDDRDHLIANNNQEQQLPKGNLL